MAFDLIVSHKLLPVNRARLAAAKRGFTTRRVDFDDAKFMITGDAEPQVGDLVLATVTKVGSHQRIELPSGRKAQLVVGDEIVVVYGNRYAPDQFEAVVGKTLERCHLVAAGGVASTMLSKHETMSAPTRIEPIGLLANARGARINLADYALRASAGHKPCLAVLVAGTSMNAGKTMTAAGIVHALSRAGHKVAGIKSTGTGAGGDQWLMADMGAHVTLDFTDFGMPSTYLAPAEQIERSVLGLIGHAGHLGCDVAVVEVADGLHHEETATLLRSPAIREAAVGMVFAANDALGAQAGLGMLRAWDYHVLALSGQLTRSPLAMREASRATGMPVVTLAEIQAGCLNTAIMKPRAFGASEFLAAGLEAA